MDRINGASRCRSQWMLITPRDLLSMDPSHHLSKLSAEGDELPFVDDPTIETSVKPEIDDVLLFGPELSWSSLPRRTISCTKNKIHVVGFDAEAHALR